MTRLENIYSENAVNIYKRLYLARNEKDEIIEDIGQCHDRVADYLAETDEEYTEFRRLLDEQKFRPNTPCMANAGVKKNPMMLACFVIDLQDDMDSIINMWSTCAKIYEGGGGAGIPITNLRRKGAVLSNGGYASGPLSYLNVIETISEEIKSGGKQRRAANLIASRYDHPDIVEIINCKRNKDNYKSMNLSVLSTDQFMKMIYNDDQMTVRLIDPDRGYEGQTISVQSLWNHICNAAWECGDPGLLFIDRVNSDNPLNIPIESTNPCGESPLWPNCCCDLGHFNINKYANPYSEEFENDVYWGVLFLNRIIDKSSYPNEKFEKNMKKYRPIGIGLMGFADILYKKKIRYGSKKSIKLIDDYTKQLTKYAFKASGMLAKEKAVQGIYQNLEKNEQKQFKEFVSRFVDLDELEDFPANITVTTLAPTGSTAMSADCSYSTEPMFGLVWTKVLDDGKTIEFLNQDFLDAMSKSDGEFKHIYSQKELIDIIKQNKGSIQKVDHLPDWIKEVFVTAHDIPNKQRIDMQAAAQKNITMAVSSTVNLPNSATIEDVSEIYKYAWKCDLKGITIYRDGSLDDQPVDFGSDSKHSEAHTEEEQAIPSTKNDNATTTSSESKIEKENPFGKNYVRPAERCSKTYEAKTPDGKLYVTGSFDHGKLMETFISIGKQGRRENTFLNGIGRVISRALQRGVELEEITDTLRGTGGDSFFFKLNETDKKSVQVNGILDALAIILDNKFSGIHFQGIISDMNEDEEIVLDDYDETENEYEIGANSLERCPECQRFSLRRDAGCRGGICTVCGFSNCQ